MKLTAGMSTLVVVATLAGPARAGDVTKVPSFDQFVVVPLRVHVVVSKEFDMTNAQITDAEVARAIPAINAIWSKAGIAFGLDSIVREPAGQLDRFQAMVKLAGGQFDSPDPFGLLLPQTASRVFDGLHLYIFRDLPMNGFYLPAADAAVTKEEPELNQVKGGTKEAMARVAARGLGQALGIATRDDEVGLLSRGTNGVGLSEVEVGQARQIAKTVPGAREVDDLAAAAAAAARRGDVEQARRAYTWLAEIPGAGPGAAEARKQLAALPAPRAK